MRAIMGWTNDEYLKAKAPTYPCLIDEKHVVAELYDMANVPMAVWIDERGRIVRPAEPAGATDGFRKMDRTTFTLAPEVAAAGRSARARYVDAIRDWAEHGAQSRYALSPEVARERIAGPSETDVLGAASFRLGQYLREHGEGARAERWFDEAKRLCPDRWNYFRQALDLVEKGSASGPQFHAAVKALGDRRYYPEVDLENAGAPGAH
ncbi:MAG: hypothetical protein IAI49_09125 [Candidatus Eremiobacteraeota bacterium]|nr:hypothetical protein [Candidatus Eremiobacteraeota bacterium]